MSTPIMYHFCHTDATGTPRLGYEDGREVRVGETLTIEGHPILCKHGLHASPTIVQALPYAITDRALTAVTLGGEIAHTHTHNKSAAQERTCLAIVDAAETARRLDIFSRWCVLKLAHLWDMPEEVRAHLESPREEDCAYAYAVAASIAYDLAEPALSAAYATADACYGDSPDGVAHNARKAGLSLEEQEAKLHELFPELEVASD